MSSFSLFLIGISSTQNKCQYHRNEQNSQSYNQDAWTATQIRRNFFSV